MTQEETKRLLAFCQDFLKRYKRRDWLDAAYCAVTIGEFQDYGGTRWPELAKVVKEALVKE